jgi:hypothetical protein
VAFAGGNVVEGDEFENYMGQMYPSTIEDTPEMRLYRERATKELLSQYGIEGSVPFYLTEEDKRKNEKLFNQGEQFKRAAERRETGRRGAEAAGKEFGLAGIMKGTDLNTPFTPFNRVAPDVAARDATRSNLPPSVAARPEPAAPAPKVDAYGLPIPDPAANLTLAQQQAKSLINVPREESQAEAIAATKQLYKDMGVDPDIYKKQGLKFEEERKGLKADKEEAKWTRLIEAGLGVMAGTSPFAAVNIGQGASPALKGFAQDIKDVKKADRELTRAQMALETTENQFKIDQSKSVQGRMEKNQERVDKAQNTVATTTATLANSINSLTGSQYDARLRDITSRAVSANTLEGTKYSANRQLEGALAYAGATRYNADKEERSIQRIMKDRNVDYTTAYGIMFDQRQRDFDRYNSLRTAVNKADDSFAATPYAMQKSNDLSKLDPKKDAAKIAKIQSELNAAKAKYRLDRGLTQESLDYLKNEDARLRNQFGAPDVNQPNPPSVGGGGFVVNTPQGPVSFTTKEQADAFRMKYNLP